MSNWLKPPKSAAVAKYVECYWLIEKLSDSDSYQFPKLNPDPAAHLIISPQNQQYSYDMTTAMTSDMTNGIGSHWLFPHKQTLQLDHSKAFVHLGIKFHVGAIYSLDLPLYTHPMLDVVKDIKLAELFTDVEISESELLTLARNDPNQCCELLDGLLLAWFANCKEDQHSKITRKALPLLDSIAISELGNKLHCSQRTLERSFNRVTGLTLKQCQAMNKLEAVLEYLYQRHSSDIDWVEVAFKFGFSDQPHLIRYLKKQIGLTPQAYAKQRGLTIDVYGGVQSS